jgi:hypothetical protein
MKTFGILETQTLVSLHLYGDETPNLESIRPRDKWEQNNADAPWNQENADSEADWSESIWIPPTIVPLVKLPQPTLDVTKEYCEPKLVWFSDRVERDWEIKTIPPIPPEQIEEEAIRKAAKLAFIEKQKILYAPYIVQPENFSLATSVEDQNAFTRLLTLLNIANASDNFETTISDVSNNLHTLTFGRFKQIMLAYGLELHNRWIQFKS